ncbi:hypothetical protein VTL71DRAFT_6189 [Oculimacula yallundae]|uniref:G domain-containing protein n=1 Tax=Oculimacula yallundae TaxID=86028 RepID=A0ABR4C0B7_9HELO
MANTRNPRPSSSGIVHFGTPGISSSLAPSEFTFRSLHNTTPEPESRPIAWSRLTISPQARHESASDTSTHSRAVSAPPQPATVIAPTSARPYDINNELVPDAPYFNADFQRGLRQAKAIAQRIANILGTCELAEDHDSHIHSMLQTANSLRNFVAPSICRIGIVGDSGVGKSSLINSLLNEINLADTAGLGAACTSVVTEYMSRLPEHTARYTIEIDRMTDLEIEE